MHPLFSSMVQEMKWSGDLGADMASFLTRNGCPETAEHCLRVGREAERLARRFGEEAASARQAGYLHDISAVIVNARRVCLARELDVPVLAEEEAVPMLLHQKLSAVLAEQVFGVQDKAILSAIGCHTTLKRGAAGLDKVVFIADKIAWDQAGEIPCLPQIRAGLTRSLDAGVSAYLAYLWQQRGRLPVVHPWMAAAHEELCVPGMV